LLATLSAACGGVTEEGAADLSLAEAEQPLDACDASALTWPSGATDSQKQCAGPFQYAMPCYDDAVGPECGEDSRIPRTCYPSCSYVTGYENTSHYTQVSPDQGSQYVCLDESPYCDPWSGIGCTGRYCYWEPYSDYDAPCAREASSAAWPWQQGGYNVTYDYWSDGWGGCSYTLYGVPVFTHGEGPQCGAGWSCDIVTYKSCRHSQHGTVAGECGLSTRYTAPGRTLQQVKDEAAQLWAQQGHVETVRFTQEPVCLSRQQLPLGTLQQVQAYFDVLDQQRRNVTALPAGAPPSGVDREQLRQQLVKQLKLLFELKGHQLTDAQLATVVTLYKKDATTSDADLSFTCGGTWTPPATGAACNRASAGVDDLDAVLRLCQRTTASHVPAEVARFALEKLCLPAADRLRALPLEATSCNGTAYRDVYRSFWLAAFERFAVINRDASNTPVAADLRASLALVQKWYDAVTNDLYRGPAYPDDLWKDLSRTYDLFWRKVYAGTLMSADSRQLQAVDPFNTGLMLDRAVISAALTQPGFSEAPQALLLGDAFRGMHERLEDFSLIHDMGCRYKGCELGTVRTEVTELWSLLGAMADEGALSTALTQATLLDGLSGTPSAEGRKAWKAVFQTLRSNHASFRDAVRDAVGATTYLRDELEARTPTSLPAPVVSLAQIIQSARARTESFARSGAFLPSSRNSLRMGIQETKQAQLDSYVTGRKTALTNLIQSYTQNRDAYVASLVAELGNSAQRTSLHAQLEQSLKRFNALADDLVGLRDNAAHEDVAFGDFARVFNRALAAEQADLALAFNRGPPQELSISAAQVRFNPATMSGNDVHRYGVHTSEGTVWTMDALPGQMLNIHTEGTWAPSCALSLVTLRKPLSKASEPLERVSLADAFTGPEGYVAVFNESGYHAESHTHSKYGGASGTVKACAGARAESGSGWNLIVKAEASVYAYAEACVQGELGFRNTNDRGFGREQRTSASYNTGIRLDDTPFPGLPAGSLLAVVVEKRASTTQAPVIRDVQVVQSPNTTLIISGKKGLPAGQTDPGVEVYLVANDVDQCSKNATRSLAVSVQKLTPEGERTRQVGQAMAAVLTQMRDKREELIAQGRVLPHEMSALRDAATSQLYAQCQAVTQCNAPGQQNCGTVCDLQQFPPSLMSLYTTFVSKELARLERMVEIRAVERQMDLLALELKAVASDLDSAETQGRLLRLVPAWHLRNLDATKLRAATRDLATLATDLLYPVLELRYPLYLEQARTAPSVAALPSLDWTQPYAGLAQGVVDAVEDIKEAIDGGRTFEPNASLTQVALSFPRPGRSTSNSPWKKVSPERARAVWDVLLDPDPSKPLRFSLQLTPEDLYERGTSSGRLHCTDGSPVLSRLALFWVRSGLNSTGNTSLNGQFVKSDTVISGEHTFPTSAGVKSYFAEDLLWRVGSTRMLFGLSDTALTTFMNEELNLSPPEKQTTTGEGLGVFSTVEFDVSGFRTSVVPLNPHLTADELVVVMQVERRAATGLPQVLACRP
jgi:hypothetical protein